jgi:hypothetical protein
VLLGVLGTIDGGACCACRFSTWALLSQLVLLVLLVSAKGDIRSQLVGHSSTGTCTTIYVGAYTFDVWYYTPCVECMLIVAFDLK